MDRNEILKIPSLRHQEDKNKCQDHFIHKNSMNTTTLQQRLDDMTLLNLFEKQVIDTPNNICLIENCIELTYWDLNRYANALAIRLHKREKFVAILLPPSVDCIVALIGIMKASKTCVPLSIDLGVRQLQYMLEQLGNPVLISTNNVLKSIELTYHSIINIDKINYNDETYEFIESNRLSHHDIAFCFFTSGTTGTPKTVMVEHHGIVNMVDWLVKEFKIISCDKSLFITNPAFDAVLVEIWPLLSVGGTICIPPEELRLNISNLIDWIKIKKVSIGNMTTPLLERFLLNDCSQLNSLRMIFCGGEPFRQLPLPKIHFNIIFCYGITECSCIITSTTITPSHGDNKELLSTNVGHPIQNVFVYVLDENSIEITTAGIIGEIYVGGVGVSRGYLNQPDINHQKFIQNFLISKSPLYKTGDLGYFLPNKNLVLVGRVDDQIKIRGCSISLTEIEKAVSEHSFIQEAVVLKDEFRNGTQTLTAYCTATDNTNTLPTLETLRTFLKGKLPYIAMPSSLIHIDSFSLNHNGKVDKKFLSKYQQPITDEELAVSQIWSQVLNLPVHNIRNFDSFISLGGKESDWLETLQKIGTLPIFKNLNLYCLYKKSWVTLSKLGCILKSKREDLKEHLKMYETLVPRPTNQIYPLSYPQKQIWLHLQNTCTSPILYNETGRCNFDCDVDFEIFKIAVKFFIDRQIIFYTTIHQNSHGEPYIHNLCIDGFSKLPIICIDLKQMDINLEDEQIFIKCFISEQVKKPFDLYNGPLWKAILIKLNTNESILYAIGHHIIIDGIGMEIMSYELQKIYKGLVSKTTVLLPPLPIQYTDFAIWQNQVYGNGNCNNIKNITWLNSVIEFWKNYLKDIKPLKFPIDKPTHIEMTNKSERVIFTLNPNVYTLVQAAVVLPYKTTFVILISALNFVLQKYTGTSDISIIMAKHGRNHPNLKGIIGHFINPIIVRTNVLDNFTFDELVQNIILNLQNCYENKDIPFQKIIEIVGFRRNIFPVAVAMVPRSSNESSIFDYLEIGNGHAKSDLLVYFDLSGNKIVCCIEYNVDLFYKKTIENLILNFQTILEQGLTFSDKKLSTYNINTMSNENLNAVIENERNNQNLSKDIEYFNGSNKIEIQIQEFLIQTWSEILKIPVENISIDSNFFELGGYSYLVPKVAIEIYNKFNIQLSFRIIFDNSTIQSLSQILLSYYYKSKSSHLQNEKMDDNTSSIIEDLNMLDWVDVIPTNTLESSLEELTTKNSISILLTGATGYLGINLLYDLLRIMDTSTIYCLIRSSSNSEAIERIQNTLNLYGLVIPPKQLQLRVVTLSGDLSKPLFKLTSPEYNSLTKSIDIVYHCASEVNFLKSYDSLKGTNVQGTKEIIKFCMIEKIKVLHYISTLGVLELDEEWKLNKKDKIRNEVPLNKLIDSGHESIGYLQSKWIAEKLVWNAINIYNLPGIIYRPGIIGSHSKYLFIHSTDFLSMMLQTCIDLGYYPNLKNLKFPYASVNFTSQSIIYISNTIQWKINNEQHKIFHIYQKLINFENIFKSFDTKHKQKVIGISLQQWKQMINYQNNLIPKFNIMTIQILNEKFYTGKTILDIIQNSEKIIYSNKNTQQVLVGSKISILVTKKDIKNYISLLFSLMV